MTHRKRTPLPIGIHLTADAVHMVQLDQAEGGLRVVSKATEQFSTPTVQPIPVASGEDDGGPPMMQPSAAHNEEALEFVRKMVATDGFRGREAAICIPPEHLIIQHVRMSPMAPEELAGALPYELQGKLPFSPNEAVVRHIEAGTVSENNETKQDVIVLAVHRSVVEKSVSAMTKIGLHVVGVGAELCAMCYSYAFAAGHTMATQEGPPCLMVVYLGPYATHVGIVRGAEITFVKGVEQGTEQLAAAVAKAKGIPEDEAVELRGQWRLIPTPEHLQEAVEVYNGVKWALDHFVDEIESCMRYHASLARGARIDRLHFVGPDARDRALVRVLSAHLGLPCEVGDPIATVTGDAGHQEPEPELAVAVGLSLFGAQ